MGSPPSCPPCAMTSLCSAPSAHTRRLKAGVAPPLSGTLNRNMPAQVDQDTGIDDEQIDADYWDIEDFGNSRYGGTEPVHKSLPIV
jgi:hypothetical protein